MFLITPFYSPQKGRRVWAQPADTLKSTYIGNGMIVIIFFVFHKFNSILFRLICPKGCILWAWADIKWHQGKSFLNTLAGKKKKKAETSSINVFQRYSTKETMYMRTKKGLGWSISEVLCLFLDIIPNKPIKMLPCSENVWAMRRITIAKKVIIVVNIYEAFLHARLWDNKYLLRAY